MLFVKKRKLTLKKNKKLKYFNLPKKSILIDENPQFYLKICAFIHLRKPEINFVIKKILLSNIM